MNQHLNPVKKYSKPSQVSIDILLTRLQGVKEIGPGKWMALCPCHPDTNPSLSIKETQEGKILLFCFGCGAKSSDIFKALGLPWQSLPRRKSKKSKNEKKKARYFYEKVLFILGNYLRESEFRFQDENFWERAFWGDEETLKIINQFPFLDYLWEELFYRPTLDIFQQAYEEVKRIEPKRRQR